MLRNMNTNARFQKYHNLAFEFQKEGIGITHAIVDIDDASSAQGGKLRDNGSHIQTIKTDLAACAFAFCHDQLWLLWRRSSSGDCVVASIAFDMLSSQHAWHQNCLQHPRFRESRDTTGYQRVCPCVARLLLITFCCPRKHIAGPPSSIFHRSLTTMMNGSSKDDAPPSALSKKQKGRLKKLRKRALEVKYGCETSGLSSLSEWTEWQELTLQQASSDTPVVGPSVRLRKQPQQQQHQWQKADGCDHQYILWNILTIHALAAGQKRRRDQDTLTPARLPPWCTLHNPSTTQSVAVIEVCLHDSCTWKEMQPHLPLLSRLLDGQDKTKVAVPVETRWFQGNQPKSVSDVLLHAHRTKNNKEKNNLQSRVMDGTASSEDALQSVVENLQELVLPRKERKKEGFPIRMENVERRMMDTDRNTRRSDDIMLPNLQAAKEIVQKCSVPIQNGDYSDQNFVATTETLHHSESPRVFAVDCEMVKTVNGVELARITLLQLTGLGQTMDEDVSYSVVMDEFVKPYEPVLDYVTEYSGVTAALLKDVATRLEQIQAAILCIMDEKDILIGHSLENDLLALRLIHDNVVDTAIVFRAKQGKRKYCK